MVTKRSNLLGSNTTKTQERDADASKRNRSRSPHRLGISSRYKRDRGYEPDAGHLLPSTTVPDKARPSQDQGEASSADCKERSKIIPTLELVAASKSGRGSDGTSSRSSRLDLEASPLGLEAPGDGGCQSEDASNMIEPMDPNPESPTSLNPADIASKENASPAVEREESPISTPSFGKMTQTKRAKKCSICHEMSHSKPRCPLLPCSYCSEMGHLTISCPFKAGRYYEGKTRANAVQIERRGLYHGKRSLDSAIKEERSEQARDLMEARPLDPAAIGKSREQAKANHCEATKKKTRRKHEEERDGDYQENRLKEAKRQYDLKRYSNPAVREKARARYRETKRKARLNDNKEDSDYYPSVRLERRIEAKCQHDAKRQRDPALTERRKDTKILSHEALGLKARNHKNDEERYDDDNDDDDDSEPVKTRMPKRESRADLDEELDRLQETDLGLAEAIIGFHRGLTTVLETSHHDKLQDFGKSGSSSLFELSSTDSGALLVYGGENAG